MRLKHKHVWRLILFLEHQPPPPEADGTAQFEMILLWH